MMRPFVRMILMCALVLAGAGVTAGPASAAGYRVGDLRIVQPWARATPPGVPMGAGYMIVRNEGDVPDRLVGADSPAAERVQVHRSMEGDGISRMVRQENGVVIPAGGSIEFAPGGYHLMLVKLHAALQAGDRLPVTLRFERAGAVRIVFGIRSLTGRSGD